MKFFAQSALDYICHQAEQQQGNGKMLFMMPSLPPQVVKDVADGLTAYCTLRSVSVSPIIKVAAPLVKDWHASGEPEIRGLHREFYACSQVQDVYWTFQASCDFVDQLHLRHR